MTATQILARFISNLKYDDLPPEVVKKGKLGIMDAVGNAIGGYPLSLSRTFLDLAKDLGGGSPEATLIGEGCKVCMPLAAFGNGALSTMLDFSDFHRGGSRTTSWLACLAVPAALAAGEKRGISGKELIGSVVAGYECGARIVHSMGMTEQRAEKVYGTTYSLFAAAGGAGRALGLDEDEMLSTLGMAGVYAPVPSYYKWLRDDGLTPRRDVKQGWAWAGLTGAFAAVSAQKGLKMLQKNNILDGDKGLWRMLGMDIFNEEALTEDLGQKYHILQFRTKLHIGCAATHSAMVGVTGLVKDNNIAPADIEKIEVIYNRTNGIGFDEPELPGVVDRQFSMPYQVAAALLAGDQGPNWYTEETANRPDMIDMMSRVKLYFDEECEQVWRETFRRMCKVTVTTKGGQQFKRRVDDHGVAHSAEQIRSKFITTASQVIGPEQINRLLDAIDNLESIGNISELIELLCIPAAESLNP